MSIEEFFSHELNEWSRSIEFYLAELDIFNERLAEVTAKNTKNAVLTTAEHFQNQFILQKENLQVLKHKVQVQKDKLQEEAKKTFGLDDLDIVDAQHFLRESVHLSEKILLELKHSFYRFLSKVF
jgi:hypothetical protein